MSKPVLWVSLTSGGRGRTSADELRELEAVLENSIGEDYNIVVADDRVRLATLDDIKDLKDQLDSLLPSEVADMETREEREQRKREEMGGLGVADVMGENEEATGVEPPADQQQATDGGDEEGDDAV